MRVNSYFEIITILVAALVLTKCDVSIRFQKTNCILHDPTTLENVKCYAKAINRTTTLINISADIVRPIKKAFINIQMNKRTGTIYRSFLVNTTENYCDIFEKNRVSPFMRTLTPVYLPYTNLNHSCPYSGFVYIRDLPVHANKLLEIWPVGNYRLDVKVIENHRDIITMQFFTETKETRF